jgi:hypothetical protein
MLVVEQRGFYDGEELAEGTIENDSPLDMLTIERFRISIWTTEVTCNMNRLYAFGHESSQRFNQSMVTLDCGATYLPPLHCVEDAHSIEVLRRGKNCMGTPAAREFCVLSKERVHNARLADV